MILAPIALVLLTQAAPVAPSASSAPVAAPTAHGEKSATPSIVIEEGDMDLGKIPSTKLHSFTITIANNGAKSCAIESIVAQCGCTAVTPIQRVVRPGSSVQVPITFNPHGYWGPVIKSIEVHSSDPVRPTFTWKFKADIQSKVIPQPKGLFLEASEGGKPNTASFRFVPATTAIKLKSLTMEETTTPFPAFEWHQETGEIKGTLSLDPGLFTAAQAEESRSKPQHGKLTLTMEDGSQDWIEVTWAIRPLFAAQPSTITLSGTRSLAQDKWLYISSQAPFRLTAAKVSSPQFDVQIDPPTATAAPPYRVLVHLKTNPKLTAGHHQEEITLQTDNPKAPEIKVPIIANIINDPPNS